MISKILDTDVSHLLSKLTIEEKISLLAGIDWWRTLVIERDDVFVPHLKTTDGPNGARGESYVSGIKAACFPCGTCLGATFDTNLLYETGRRVALEAKTKAAHILLAPTLNVIRSPLGGRNYETYSEDPFLLGALAAAYVNGCQNEGVAATPKHFVANEAENQRKVLSVEVDEQTLREIYLRPFQLVMKLSDPWCFMSSYNKVNGTYVADSKRLIDGVLREEWGFHGLVMSDWMGTYSTGPGIEAGVDLEMPGPPKWRTTAEVLDLVNQGSVSLATIDKSVERVLQLAKHLGRFEQPEEPPERAVEDPLRDAYIRDSAADGIVLLKNDNVLPLPKNASLAVIGQHASTTVLGGGGSARVDALHAVNVIDGLKSIGFDIKTAPGVPVFGSVPHPDPKIVFECGRQSQSANPVKVEWFNGDIIGTQLVHEEQRPHAEYMIKEQWPSYLSKEYCSRMTFDIIAPSTGKHLMSVISTGRALCYINEELVFERTQEKDLKLESFYFYKRQLEKRFSYYMEKGQRYTIRLESWATEDRILNAAPLFGKMYQGSAVRFHEHIDLEVRLQGAAAAAKDCDYAVVCVGTINEIESEGFDRDTMDLTEGQCRLVEAVASGNPKTIVVNFSGAPVSMYSIVGTVPAIVQAWFPGQEAGHSVAAVLSGNVNPSGKLPLSWPKKLEDNPSFGNFPADENNLLRYEEKLDVGYRWFDRQKTPDPLFAFGFGLSYTTFTISDAQVQGSTSLSAPNQSITIKTTVHNSGCRPGKTVVQVYVRNANVVPGWQRPIKELQAFAKIDIGAGEEKVVILTLDKYSFSVYDAKRSIWLAKEGRYQACIGFSSTEISHELDLSIPTDFDWVGL